MNYDERVIKIIYKTVEENLKKFDTPLERYDNWKDDIITKVQDYIEELNPGYIKGLLEEEGEWNCISLTDLVTGKRFENGKLVSRKEQE